MGYVEIIKDGLLVKMVDGEVRRVTPTAWCDKCNSQQDPIGGIGIENLDKQVVLWICAKCRKE
jgi:hypothetical protein